MLTEHVLSVGCKNTKSKSILASFCRLSGPWQAGETIDAYWVTRSFGSKAASNILATACVLFPPRSASLCLSVLSPPAGFLQVLMAFSSFSADETFPGVFCPFTSSYPPLLSCCGSWCLALLRRTTTVNRKQSSPPHTKTTCRPRNLHTQTQRCSWTSLFRCFGAGPG